MSRILIITLVFAPDGVSTANLVSDMAIDLSDHGHEVSVLTTVPHFNFDSDSRNAQPLEKKAGGLYWRSTYLNKIDVLHTAIIKRGEGAGVKRRMLAYMIFHIISFFLGLFVIGKIDIILVVSPPLTSGLVSWSLGFFKRAKIAYNVQELYPDTYVQNGALKPQGLITRIFYAIEKFVYKTSDILIVISNDFRQSITKKGVNPEKIYLIPNFVDVDRLKPGSKDNPFARDLNLVDKFVVLYAGNIGLTQSFNSILAAAESLEAEKDIMFLIVGDGVNRNHVAEMIEAKKLTNVILEPYQPFGRVPEIYASADVALVPLTKGNAHVTLPSKIYTIMSTGTAALVAVDMDSEIVSEVQAGEVGLTVPPDDAEALAASIIELYKNPEERKKYAANGRLYALENYSRNTISSKYKDLLNTLVTL